MSFSILGEIAEFSHQVITLFKSAPPEAVAVVIVGSVLFGFFSNTVWRRWRGSKPPPTGANQELEICRSENKKLAAKNILA